MADTTMKTDRLISSRVLAQFKLRVRPTDPVIRALPDETLTEAVGRRDSRRKLQQPEVAFHHTGGMPRKLLEILQNENLKLVDAGYQKRLSIGFQSIINDHILITFEFRATSENPPKRQAELDGRGMDVLKKEYLDLRYEQIRVVSFPGNEQHLMSFLFVGRAQQPQKITTLEHERAELFGIEITRRLKEIRQQAG